MAARDRLKPAKQRTAPARRLSAFRVPELGPELAVSLRQTLAGHNFMTGQPAEADQGQAESLTLHALFVLGEGVLADQAARALGAQQTAELTRAGLLREARGRVRSLFQAQNYQGLILLSDFFHDSHKSGFVLQVGPAGRYLADLTIRRPFGSALDLGCGCGVQALLAARHCGRVTASDLNPRALQLTRLNASLNGVDNLETLQGSYFAPVKERAFDLIVANLPYVITPENKYLYRDSGSAGDANLYALLRELPAHLNEAGFAHVLANWIHAPGQPYWQPFSAALLGLPVDTWLFHNGSKQPAEYAEMWVDIPPAEATAYEEKMKDWLEWYQGQRIERIALGAVTLRRRSAAHNWGCSATVKKALSEPAGAQIFELFQAQDRLEQIEMTGGWENVRLVPAQPEAGRQALANGRLLCSAPGMEITAEVQSGALQILKTLDGRTGLGQALRLANLPVEKMLEDVKALISVGVLRFAD